MINHSFFKTKYLSLIVIFATIGCTSRIGFQGNNVAHAYDSKNLTLNPDYYVHHINDSVSEVHYRIKSTDLIYEKNVSEKNYIAKFGIEYSLIPSFESIAVIDSGFIKSTDKAQQPPQKAIIGSFKVKFKVFFRYTYFTSRVYI